MEVEVERQHRNNCKEFGVCLSPFTAGDGQKMARVVPSPAAMPTQTSPAEHTHSSAEPGLRDPWLALQTVMCTIRPICKVTLTCHPGATLQALGEQRSCLLWATAVSSVLWAVSKAQQLLSESFLNETECFFLSLPLLLPQPDPYPLWVPMSHSGKWHLTLCTFPSISWRSYWATGWLTNTINEFE